MNRVHVPACEAEYLGPVVETSDFCQPRTRLQKQVGVAESFLDPALSSDNTFAEDISGPGLGIFGEPVAGESREAEQIDVSASHTTSSQQDGHDRHRRRGLRARSSRVGTIDFKRRVSEINLAPEVNVDSSDINEFSSPVRGTDSRGYTRESAGSLVVHIRSGDIFGRHKKYFPQYGQVRALLADSANITFFSRG